MDDPLDFRGGVALSRLRVLLEDIEIAYDYARLIVEDGARSEEPFEEFGYGTPPMDDPFVRIGSGSLVVEIATDLATQGPLVLGVLAALLRGQSGQPHFQATSRLRTTGPRKRN